MRRGHISAAFSIGYTSLFVSRLIQTNPGTVSVHSMQSELVADVAWMNSTDKCIDCSKMTARMPGSRIETVFAIASRVDSSQFVHAFLVVVE